MFIDEVMERLKLKNTDFILPKITLLGKGIVLVDGHKGVLYFTESEIHFRIKNGIIKIDGENLVINEISNVEAIVSGKIVRFEYV